MLSAEEARAKTIEQPPDIYEVSRDLKKMLEAKETALQEALEKIRSLEERLDLSHFQEEF